MISLRDTGALPRTYLFAESQISGARQRILCREPALGKDRLLAKPSFAESSTLGKDWLSAKPNFAESSTLGKQKISAKPQPHKCPPYAVIFAESLLLGSRQNIFFAESLSQGSRQIFFLDFCSLIFLVPYYSTRSQYLKFGVFSISLAIFSCIFFHFLDFFHKTHI
jgi:hypothetical protein